MYKNGSTCGFYLTLLDKSKLNTALPPLFDLLYFNMKDITPLLPYGDERAEWFGAVLPAMKKDKRQIILAHRGEELAGFLQYYINGELLMIEEVQLKERFRRTSLILCLARFLCARAGEGVRFVEAYAHRLNGYSRAVISSLGMREIGEIPDIEAIHYRGDAAPLLERFRKKK